MGRKAIATGQLETMKTDPAGNGEEGDSNWELVTMKTSRRGKRVVIREKRECEDKE